MSLRFQNLPQFQRELRSFAEVTKKPAQDVVKQQAALFDRDVAKMTPPMGGEGEGPITQSWAAQRKTGQKAVDRDIHKLFRSASSLKALNGIKNKKSLQTVTRYLQTGQIVKLQTVLRKMRIKADVITAATAQIHSQNRDSRGHVRGGKFFLVMDSKSIETLSKAKQKLVGWAKSGWKEASEALGVKLPNWIKDKPGSGLYKANFRGSFNSILLGNTVEFIQSAGAKLAIIERALKRRSESMRNQMDAMVKRSFQGYKGKR